jgi:ferredoxin
MITVRFLKADGSLDHEVEAPPGTNLLDLAQREGQMACSTCHVVVAKEDFSRLPPAGEEEDDLLDLAWQVRPTSRLACQINLTDDLGTLTVQMPGGAYNLDR